MHEFNQSLKYDKRMYDADIRGSIAYSKSLALVGILTQDEETKIVNGLEAVKKEWDDGVVSPISTVPIQLKPGEAHEVEQFQIQPDDEDIHTANERRLTELIGPLGGKLHTGRSRNDQVATDMRLWLMKEAREIETALKALIQVIVSRADKERDILMPGYTHLQVCLHSCRQTRGLTETFSAPNPCDGHILSSPMLSTSPLIFSACGRRSLVSLSSHWDQEPLPETPSSWIESSSQRSSDLIPSPRTASTA